MTKFYPADLFPYFIGIAIISFIGGFIMGCLF